MNNDNMKINAAINASFSPKGLMVGDKVRVRDLTEGGFVSFREFVPFWIEKNQYGYVIDWEEGECPLDTEDTFWEEAQREDYICSECGGSILSANSSCCCV